MKFSFLVLSVLFLSSNAFAISDAELKAACLETGKAKLQAVADANKCHVILDPIAATYDNRWYNPSKYIWYSAESDCGIDGYITQLVQYHDGECI